jgi:hypothetical protein
VVAVLMDRLHGSAFLLAVLLAGTPRSRAASLVQRGFFVCLAARPLDPRAVQLDLLLLFSRKKKRSTAVVLRWRLELDL